MKNKKNELTISKFRKVVYVVVLFLCMFALSELGTRLVCFITNQYPAPFDKSLAHEWKWAARHLEEKTSYIPNMYEYDSQLGWTNTANYKREVWEYDGKKTAQKTGYIQINSQHIRSDQEYSLEPPHNKTRLLLVGDSYSFGVEVANHRIFSDILNKQYLQNSEVLNLAVPGTGTDQQVLMWELYGKKYRPHVVILGFYVRDFTRNLVTFKGYSKPRFVLNDDGEGKLINYPVPSPQEIYDEYFKGQKKIYSGYYSYLTNFLFTRPYEKILKRRTRNAPGWKILSYLMDRFTKAVKETGASPLWLILPSRDSLEDVGDYDGIVAMSEARAKNLSLPFLDLTAPFRKYHKESPHPPIYRPEKVGGHLSHTGHELVAKVLAQFLQEKELLFRKN